MVKREETDVFDAVCGVMTIRRWVAGELLIGISAAMWGGKYSLERMRQVGMCL